MEEIAEPGGVEVGVWGPPILDPRRLRGTLVFKCPQMPASCGAKYFGFYILFLALVKLEELPPTVCYFGEWSLCGAFGTN